MKLKINREFLTRRIFVLLVFGGMGVWFGYDGFVRYPEASPAALYEMIETTPPPAGMAEEKLLAFKNQKVAAQRGLCGALLLAALCVAVHLASVARFSFAFDEGGFTWRGRRYSFSDIKSVDRSRWEKKGIIRLSLAGGTVTLDAWHHSGVDAFEKLLSR